MAYDKTAVRKILDQAKAAGRSSLTAPEAKGICEAYGIAIPKEGVAANAADAAKLASSIGFPVVMKIVSPQILHKTEAPSTPSSPMRAATSPMPPSMACRCSRCSPAARK